MPAGRHPVTAPPEDAGRRGNAVAAHRLNQKIVVGAVFVSAMFMNIMDINISV